MKSTDAIVPRSKSNTSMCSAARSLELLGDRWALLLIREVVFGTHRFDDFAEHLGIARNVLTTKLSGLLEADILMQRPLKQDSKRMGYHLTEMGEGLLPVLLALMQWGDRWLQTPDSIPIRIIERATGDELAPIRLHNAAGKELTMAEVDWAPGPGARHPSIARLAAAYEAQRRVTLRPIPKTPTKTKTKVPTA